MIYNKFFIYYILQLMNEIKVSSNLIDKYDLSIWKPYFKIYKYRFSIKVFISQYQYVLNAVLLK